MMNAQDREHAKALHTPSIRPPEKKQWKTGVTQITPPSNNCARPMGGNPYAAGRLRSNLHSSGHPTREQTFTVPRERSGEHATKRPRLNHEPPRSNFTGQTATSSTLRSRPKAARESASQRRASVPASNEIITLTDSDSEDLGTRVDAASAPPKPFHRNIGHGDLNLGEDPDSDPLNIQEGDGERPRSPLLPPSPGIHAFDKCSPVPDGAHTTRLRQLHAAADGKHTSDQPPAQGERQDDRISDFSDTLVPPSLTRKGLGNKVLKTVHDEHPCKDNPKVKRLETLRRKDKMKGKTGPQFQYKPVTPQADAGTMSSMMTSQPVPMALRRFYLGLKEYERVRLTWESSKITIYHDEDRSKVLEIDCKNEVGEVEVTTYESGDQAVILKTKPCRKKSEFLNDFTWGGLGAQGQIAMRFIGSPKKIYPALRDMLEKAVGNHSSVRDPQFWNKHMEIIRNSLGLHALTHSRSPTPHTLSARGQETLRTGESSVVRMETTMYDEEADVVGIVDETSKSSRGPDCRVLEEFPMQESFARSEAISSVSTRTQGQRILRNRAVNDTTKEGSTSQIVRRSARRIQQEEDHAPPKLPEKEEVILIYPPNETGAVNITNYDFARLDPCQYINDTLLEFGVKFILKKLETENPSLWRDVHVFSSFFYKKLNVKDMNEGYESVRKWTAKFNIFDKKYVFVPINENFHWYLVIIYQPGLLLEAPSQEDLAKQTPRRSLRTSQAAASIPTAMHEELAGGPSPRNSPEHEPEPENDAVEAASTRAASPEIDFMGQVKQPVSPSKSPVAEVVEVSADDALAPNDGSALIGIPLEHEVASAASEGHGVVEIDDHTDEEPGSPMVLDPPNVDRAPSAFSERLVYPPSREPTEVPCDDSAESPPSQSFSHMTLDAPPEGSSLEVQVGIDEDAAMDVDSDEAVEVMNSLIVSETDRTSPVEPEQLTIEHVDVDVDVDAHVPDVSPAVPSPTATASNVGAIPPTRFYGSVGRKKRKHSPDAPPSTPPRPQVTRTVIMTLDSLGSSHRRAVNVIDNYLRLEADDKKRRVHEVLRSTTSKVAQVPLQPNYFNCGIYVLHFIETFLTDPEGYYRKTMDSKGSVKAEQRKADWQESKIEGIREAMKSHILELSEEWKKERNARNEQKKKEEAELVDSSEGEVEFVGMEVSSTKTRGNAKAKSKGKQRAKPTSDSEEECTPLRLRDSEEGATEESRRGTRKSDSST